MTTSPIETKDQDTAACPVRLDSVSKKYPLMRMSDKSASGDLKDFWALKDVSFELEKGRVLGVIGRNGAGKTTLLNIIAGTLTPTEGAVSLKGRVLGLFNLGVGFQDELTGRENIFLNGAILGAGEKELAARMDPIIEFSELGNFIDMRLGTYSQGMRLRLAFSIIANLDFDILVIDEVLTVGDVLFQNKCFEKIMGFRRSGKSLVISTQDMGLIERLCDKAMLLDHGRLLFCGVPGECITRYHKLLNSEKFFVGPVKERTPLVEDTKKWAEDRAQWGKKLGTKEAEIEYVDIIDKSGRKTSRIKTRDPLKVKVGFRVKDAIKNAHFGISIFRDDGVYCYGANTAFDGISIPEIAPGRGYFILTYKDVMLAPDEYRISAAIWDKNETVAFDYHVGCYALTVLGRDNPMNQLLNLPYSFDPMYYVNRSLKYFKTGRSGSSSGEEIDLKIRFRNVSMTNSRMDLFISLDMLDTKIKDTYLYLEIYRADGVYCQLIRIPVVKKNDAFRISFAVFPLLPGAYRMSYTVWDDSARLFLMRKDEAFGFKMVHDKKDHGTIYLEHKWEWRTHNAAGI